MTVVTIVVLLILAGITITYVMGDNSVFKQAQNTKLQTEIAKAREKLEITFGQAKIFKHTDNKYNQDDYLDDLMRKEISNIKILDNVVIVDGYAFEIDRSEPKIGKYVGEEKDLVFPKVTTNVMLAEDNKTATIHITAKEAKNGISKIEIIQGGYVLETYECGNSTEEITKDYIAKQNGSYTIKVYAVLNVSEKATVEGIIPSVKYNPNGNDEYKKEHQVQLIVEENVGKVKNIKYQWLQTTVEPASSTFTETCDNNSIVVGKDLTGTYYLWTLIETEDGKTNIGRSETFNFDNQGPVVTVNSSPVSLTAFTLNVTANDDYSGIEKYEFYVNDELKQLVETDKETASYTVENVITGNTNCYVIVTDTLGNKTKKTITGVTKLYAWTKWNCTSKVTYSKSEGSVQGPVTFQFTPERMPVTSLSGPNSSGMFTFSGFIGMSGVVQSGYYCPAVGSGWTWGGQFERAVAYKLVELKFRVNPNSSVQEWTYRKISAVKKTTYSKGTTSYGTVTSASENAYKSGQRNSDGFWYVSISPQ